MAKKTMVLIPGWAGSSKDWKDQKFDKFEILTPDYPQSQNQLIFTSLAKDIISELENRKANNPILVAHSMGALVSFEYLSLVKEKPDLQPSDLVLVAPVFADSRKTAPYGRYSLTTLTSKFLLTNFESKIENGKISDEALSALKFAVSVYKYIAPISLRGLGVPKKVVHEFENFVDRLINMDERKRADSLHQMLLYGSLIKTLRGLGTFELPKRTILIGGSHDTLVDIEKASKALGVGSMIKLKDSGHFPFAEYPELFNSALMSALSD